MRKLILTDVDDTCLEWARPFQAYVRAKGVATRGELRETYEIDTVFQIPRDQSDAYIRGFAAEMGERYPAEVCAKDAIPALYGLGYDFVAITACGLDPLFRLKRVRNLQNVFGFPFEDVHVVDFMASKEAILRAYDPAIWVEDNFGHACVGAGLGHRTFLIDRPYNQGMTPDGVVRVRDWYDISDYLREES